jgi:AcrR family transcriptional regulator
MGSSRQPRPRRKRPDRYHHGDLRRALLEEAVRTIQSHGVERLTLRDVGERLGVSRSALYRHFADKGALLAAVAREGFRTLRLGLLTAWEEGSQGEQGLAAMGGAYVRFAVSHPSHYRVMFGGLVKDGAHDPELMQEASGAFQALVDALVAQQRAGLVRDDEPIALARFVWAVVHGVAMLAIDGQLKNQQADLDNMIGYTNDRIRFGIASEASKGL